MFAQTTTTIYYPFGWQLPGRQQQTAENYRYSYQGQFAEQDDETGWNAFEARMYDGRDYSLSRREFNLPPGAVRNRWGDDPRDTGLIKAGYNH